MARLLAVGFDILEQPLEVKKRIGYLPRNASGLPGKCALRNIWLLLASSCWLEVELRTRVDYACERCANG